MSYFTFGGAFVPLSQREAVLHEATSALGSKDDFTRYPATGPLTPCKPTSRCVPPASATGRHRRKFAIETKNHDNSDNIPDVISALGLMPIYIIGFDTWRAKVFIIGQKPEEVRKRTDTFS